MEGPVIYLPGVTYQYGEQGELDSSMPRPTLPFDETVRERFKQRTIANFSNRPQAWARLGELIAAKLQALPDNPFVRQDAWLCGLTEDGGPYVQGLFDRLQAYRDEIAQREADRQALEAERQSLEAEIEVKVLSQSATMAMVEVTARVGGQTLAFVCRNVFDVGYVVNPNYSVAPGLKPGGIANAGQWMNYTDGQGWQPVRALTDFEKKAQHYLTDFSPIRTAMRM